MSESFPDSRPGLDVLLFCRLAILRSCSWSSMAESRVKLDCLGLRAIGACRIASPVVVEMLVEGISSGLRILCSTSGFKPKEANSSATFLMSFFSCINQVIRHMHQYPSVRLGRAHPNDLSILDRRLLPLRGKGVGVHDVLIFLITSSGVNPAHRFGDLLPTTHLAVFHSEPVSSCTMLRSCSWYSFGADQMLRYYLELL
jgi:hypothetical protein